MPADPSAPQGAYSQQEDTESALARYLNALAAHWTVVLLIVGAAVAGTLAFASQRTASYEATSTVVVVPIAQNDRAFLGLDFIRDSGDASRTLQTAATVLDSPAAAARTARQRDGMTAADVQGAIRIQPQGESNVLAIVARASSPNRAVGLANTFTRATLGVRSQELMAQVRAAIAKLRARAKPKSGDYVTSGVLADRLDQLQAIRDTGRDPTVALSRPASLPATRVGASRSLILIIGALAGFVLASMAVLLLEYFDRRVRDEDELVRLTGLPILSRVPRLPRRLTRGGPVPPLSLTEPTRDAFRSLATQLRHRTQHQGTIMMASACDGDGKTTATAGLAQAFSDAGYSTILIDLDLRKPGLEALFGGGGAAPALSHLTSDPDRLAEHLMEVPGLPGTSVLCAGNGDAGNAGRIARHLPELVAAARGIADFVVLDTSALGEVSDGLSAVQSADQIVLVSRIGHTDRERLGHVRDLLERTGGRPVGIVETGGTT